MSLRDIYLKKKPDFFVYKKNISSFSKLPIMAIIIKRDCPIFSNKYNILGLAAGEMKGQEKYCERVGEASRPLYTAD